MMSESEVAAANTTATEDTDAVSDSELFDRSSSTEGPDSPGQLSNVSPIPPMMMSASSPPPPADGTDGDPGAQVPRYSVRFTDHITKDGDAIRYKINVRKMDLQNPDPDIITIEREYDDIEFLHHTMTTQNKLDGIIVPPLPPRPAADPKEAEARSKKQLGSGNRNMQGDDFLKDCRQLEKYMQLMTHHPLFGRDQHLAEFLERPNPPIRAKIKKGFLSGMKIPDVRGKASAKDMDEFFQKERDWANQYGAQLKQACDKFHQVMYSQLRLSNQLTHLATSLNASVGGGESANAFYNRLNSRFSTCLEEERRGVEAEVGNEENTLGTYLSLYANYLDNENTMLHRRTCLMVDYDNASKSLAKAKPNKVEPLKISKDIAEKEFKSCSEVAQREIKRFHSLRLHEMKESLIHYAEGQIKCARDSQGALEKCLMKMRDFPVPELSNAAVN